MGMSYWSLSAYLKNKVKSALNYISDFEEAVAGEAKKRGFQAVVCGHIHKAEIRDVDGITYCNDGDWVESCTALVEHFDGRLEILYCPFQPVSVQAKLPLSPELPLPNPELVMPRH